MSQLEIIDAAPGVARPEGSAFARLTEGHVYVRFIDPFSDCPQHKDHASAVEILIENTRLNLARFGSFLRDTNTLLLPCDHQVSVRGNNHGGMFNIEEIDIRPWRQNETTEI